MICTTLVALIVIEMTTINPIPEVVYLKNGFHCTELPCRFNFNDVEITIMVINQPIPNLHIIGIDRSETKVNMPNFIDVLNHLYNMKL